MRKEQSAQPPRPNNSASCLSVFAGFMIGGLLGLVVGGGFGVVALILIIETGPASAKGNLDGATGMGGIIVLGAVVGGAIGAFKGINRAFR